MGHYLSEMCCQKCGGLLCKCKKLRKAEIELLEKQIGMDCYIDLDKIHFENRLIRLKRKQHANIHTKERNT